MIRSLEHLRQATRWSCLLFFRWWCSSENSLLGCSWCSEALHLVFRSCSLLSSKCSTPQQNQNTHYCKGIHTANTSYCFGRHPTFPVYKVFQPRSPKRQWYAVTCPFLLEFAEQKLIVRQELWLHQQLNKLTLPLFPWKKKRRRLFSWGRKQICVFLTH